MCNSSILYASEVTLIVRQNYEYFPCEDTELSYFRL